MSIFVSRKRLKRSRQGWPVGSYSTYFDDKNCEGVAEVMIANNMWEGFRGIVHLDYMGLGNLKPNIVCIMWYPEIWREKLRHSEIPETW